MNGASPVAPMDLTTRLAAILTHRLRRLRGTQGAFTIDLEEDVFVQAASYEGDAVLLEVTGDEFLLDRRLTPAQHGELLRLGFHRPSPDLPNWWIGVEDGHDRSLFAAARAAITALREVYEVDADALAAAFEVIPSESVTSAMVGPDVEIQRID